MNRYDELQLTFREPDPALEIHTAESWRGVCVQYSRLTLPAEYEFTWDGHCHYLAYHDLILVDGEMEVLGERPAAAGDLRDLMTYVPSGMTFDGWAKPAGRLNAFTVVCFDPAAMEEELQVEFNSPQPRPHIYFQRDALGTKMRKLSRLMADQDGAVSRIYAETLGLAAALEMFRISQEDARPAHGSGQLSRNHAHLVPVYIEENLSTDIGLDELAAVCGLTRFHFSRAFKATFGESPYQYVTRRRIERAQQMLVATRLSIADVAAACGFKGASQFGRSFRDVVGQSPLAFRRTA